VRDEQDPDAGPLLKVEQEAQDLTPDRHVRAGERLVGDQQLRSTGQRDRQEATLPHAPGQLVGISVLRGGREQPRTLSEAERTALRRLATDIPALGAASTTTDADRKELIRGRSGVGPADRLLGCS
jgi:hypothetical protein